MTDSAVSYGTNGSIGVISINNPPVNALSQKVRQGISDALEESLDVLDERYQSVSEVLKIDLFYDSPQIRQVVADIKKCQDSILYVANEIGRLEEIQDGEEESR